MTQDIDINDNIIQDNSDDIYNKAELEIVKEDDDFFPYIIKGNIEKESQIEKNIDKNYIILKKYTINEKKALNDQTMLNLINMTPLSKNYSCDKKISKITIALNIYVLKVRKKYE